MERGLNAGERRDEDLIKESIRLRSASPDELLKSLDQLDRYIIESAKAGIKMRKPGISQKDLSLELKKTFA